MARKDILNILLDQYECSKTYRGENKFNQTFSIPPERVFPEYNSDFADLRKIQEFEQQLKLMEAEGLVSLRHAGPAIQKIEKIVANPSRWNDYYRITERTPKKDQQNSLVELYKSFVGNDPLLDRFCNEQIERVRNNKKAVYEGEVARNVLKFLQFILKNDEDILERELSIAVMGDSKIWENSYRTRVCRILRGYGDFENLLSDAYDSSDQEDKREVERILLAEFHVYSNPSYIYFKGNGILYFSDGKEIRIYEGMPMALSSKSLENLQKIQVLADTVMTIENLTSFNRMKEKKSFLIFLSGYHNTAKQKLIRKIYEDNPELQWFHFGDMDPDGFLILENLRRGTGIDFQPAYMDIETLKNYSEFTKPLMKNDIRKAQTLIKNKKYQDVLKYMLDGAGKLEQEIISWAGN